MKINRTKLLKKIDIIDLYSKHHKPDHRRHPIRG